MEKNSYYKFRTKEIFNWIALQHSCSCMSCIECRDLFSHNYSCSNNFHNECPFLNLDEAHTKEKFMELIVYNDNTKQKQLDEFLKI